MKKIQVLMSTYNGEKYLREQLDSIIGQVDVEASILVRDDGSQDDTIKILEEYQNEGKLYFFTGKNLGYGRSFLNLITRSTDVDYYAYADQDDVWESDKLICAIKCLELYGDKKPLLYASALTYVDTQLNYIGKKSFKKLRLDLGSALVRQRLAGCTMVFNNELRNRCSQCFEISDRKFGHDGWTYLLCLATGGKVIYDSVSHIKYRRHNESVTVSGNSIATRIKREFAKFSTLKDTQYNASVSIVDKFADLLTDSAMLQLKQVAEYKDSIGKTVKLALNKELRCGLFSVDLFNKFVILFRCF